MVEPVGCLVEVAVGVRVWVDAGVEDAAWVVADFVVAVGVKTIGAEADASTGVNVSEAPWVTRGSMEVAVGSLTEVGG